MENKVLIFENSEDFIKFIEDLQEAYNNSQED